MCHQITQKLPFFAGLLGSTVRWLSAVANGCADRALVIQEVVSWNCFLLLFPVPLLVDGWNSTVQIFLHELCIVVWVSCWAVLAPRRGWGVPQARNSLEQILFELFGHNLFGCLTDLCGMQKPPGMHSKHPGASLK